MYTTDSHLGRETIKNRLFFHNRFYKVSEIREKKTNNEKWTEGQSVKEITRISLTSVSGTKMATGNFFDLLQLVGSVQGFRDTELLV